MAIEITGHNQARLSNAKAETKGQVGGADLTLPKQHTGQPSNSDTITFTDRAARLQKLEAAVSSLPIVDTARVEDVKQAINNGCFHIYPLRVAEKLINFEKARGGGVS